MRVPYAYRRAIVQDGDLPHLSTRVAALPAGKKRVILGINAYSAVAGARLQQLPDHSRQWLNKLKLYQALARCSPAQRATLLGKIAQRPGAAAAKQKKAPPPPSPFAACKARYGDAWATMAIDEKRAALADARAAIDAKHAEDEAAAAAVASST